MIRIMCCELSCDNISSLYSTRGHKNTLCMPYLAIRLIPCLQYKLYFVNLRLYALYLMLYMPAYVICYDKDHVL